MQIETWRRVNVTWFVGGEIRVARLPLEELWNMNRLKGRLDGWQRRAASEVEVK